jgi:aminoglycoside 2''-phosphotransferase
MTVKLQGYLKRIQNVYSHLTIHEAVLNQEGLVNDVVIVNGDLVCRFGKHEWAAENLRHEYNCLALARRHVELALPAWTWHDEDFISYELIRGIPLQRYHVMEAGTATRQALAEQLGSFLSQLHTIPIHELEAQGIEPSVTNRSPRQWLRMYAEVQQELFPLLMASARQWVHHHFTPLLDDPAFLEGRQTMMHGDLATYHLLYNPDENRLEGVIDFGTAGLGDPACDLAGIIEEYGESFLCDLDPYYREIGALIERARFWAGNLELEWLLGGLHNPDDPSWFAVHIGRARDVMPIGSGW